MNKSLGQVFGSAWNTMRNNFGTLLLGTLLMTLPTTLLSMWADELQQYYYLQSAALLIQMIVLLYSLFVMPLVMGYITSILRSYHLTGAPATMKTAWAAAKANYVRYLLTTLAVLVIVLVFALIVGVVVGLFMAGSMMSFFSVSSGMSVLSQVSMILGMMLPALIVAVVVIIFFVFCLSFYQFIPGMEGIGAFRAVFKSFKYIFKGNFWKSLGHMLLIGIIMVAIELLILLPFYIPFMITLANADLWDITMGTQNLLSFTPLYTIISGIVGIFIQTFVTPYVFEVYLNAKAVSDGKDSKHLQTGYSDINDPFMQNGQYPQDNQPPHYLPGDRQ